jgi:hypothetical protein
MLSEQSARPSRRSFCPVVRFGFAAGASSSNSSITSSSSSAPCALCSVSAISAGVRRGTVTEVCAQRAVGLRYPPALAAGHIARRKEGRRPPTQIRGPFRL